MQIVYAVTSLDHRGADCRLLADWLQGHWAIGNSVHHVRDVHVTLLHLLGLDDNQLTYFHGGRFKQLSQFGGRVIRELIA